MSRVSFRQRDLQAALKAAMAVGISAPTVEIKPDGTMVLLTGAPPSPEVALSPLEKWRRENGAGRA